MPSARMKWGARRCSVATRERELRSSITHVVVPLLGTPGPCTRSIQRSWCRSAPSNTIARPRPSAATACRTRALRVAAKAASSQESSRATARDGGEITSVTAPSLTAPRHGLQPLPSGAMALGVGSPARRCTAELHGLAASSLPERPPARLPALSWQASPPLAPLGPAPEPALTPGKKS